MKNKHLWLALGEGLLFMILFLHRYELEWMCWVQDADLHHYWHQSSGSFAGIL